MKDVVGRTLMRWRLRVVRPHIVGRVLDIGCGANLLVRNHPGGGVGVDVYQWGAVDIVVQDSSKLPLSDGGFDTVTIVAALNHIPNRADVLSEAFRVLRAGGRVIVTMIPPFISGIWHKLRAPWDADQRHRGMRDGEVYGLTQSSVRRLIKNAGFQIILEKRFMLGINRLTIAEKPMTECAHVPR